MTFNYLFPLAIGVELLVGLCGILTHTLQLTVTGCAMALFLVFSHWLIRFCLWKK